MKQTTISKKISMINYVIFALAELGKGKGTNTHKFLLKVWLLSSIFTFITSVIVLSFIGTLVTDTILIKFIIYLSLFGVSSILPSFLFGFIYYLAVFIEKINLFINFLYFVKFKQLFRIIGKIIKRELRLSSNEIYLYQEKNLTFIEKMLGYFHILLNITNKEFIHTKNVIFTAFYVSFFLLFLSAIVFSENGDRLLYLYNIFFAPLLFISLILIFSFIIYVISFIMYIVYKIPFFFKEMKKDYIESKKEIKDYIDVKLTNC